METKKPNILFISLGDSSFIREDRMILKGFTHLYTYSFPPKESSIKLFNAIFLLKNFLLQFFWLLVNIRKASLIYCWFADYHGFLPALFAKIVRIPVVTVLGGTDANIVPSLGYGVLLSKWRRVLSTVLIKNSRLLLPVDETLIQSNEISKYWPESHPNGLKNNIHSLKTPWKTIPTGYSADAWPEPTNVKREKIVSTVAFLNPERTALIKGIDFFIETARCLPDFTFKIVGVSPEVARVLTQKYAPSTNVEMLPPMERAKLANIYAETSVYCQLSRTEGLPNVLCEAMICGCFFCSIPKVCMSYFGGA